MRTSCWCCVCAICIGLASLHTYKHVKLLYRKYFLFYKVDQNKWALNFTYTYVYVLKLKQTRRLVMVLYCLRPASKHSTQFRGQRRDNTIRSNCGYNKERNLESEWSLSIKWSSPLNIVAAIEFSIDFFDVSFLKTFFIHEFWFIFSCIVILS